VPRRDRRNLSSYWHAPGTRGLSLMTADFTSHEYPPHRHEALVVAVTEEGGAEVKSRGVIGQAHRSALYVFNPDEPHAGWMGDSPLWRYRGFYLAGPALASLSAGLGLQEPCYFTQNAFQDADLIEAFLALHRALEDPAAAVEAHELFLASFGALFARHGQGKRPPPPKFEDRALLARARAILEERHAESVVLEDVAAPLGLTEYQLIHLFKRTVGLTPHAYLIQLRLAEACRALRRGLPLAEAATLAGFYDQAALNKHFKRCYGMTPLQFQRASAGAGTARFVRGRPPRDGDGVQSRPIQARGARATRQALVHRDCPCHAPSTTSIPTR
jgi:AraC-like DNA-binding protein